VRTLVEQGAQIVALDIQEKRLAESFGNDDGVTRDLLDVGDPAACTAVVDRSVAKLGGIDALIHFAAAWTGSTWEESDPAEWDRILSTNLKGTFFLAKAVAKHMVAQGFGSIVLTASDSARVGGVAGGPAYVASKGGVIAVTRSLAKALGPSGIRVNAINPGVVDTPMTQSWPAAIKEGAIARTPLGRLALPEDISDVACFLASDQARCMSGEIVEDNGGAYFD
jgi:NAD(P)-dependent dehydrogenase (short-subunit alcohol dehydrogenase family)